MKTIFVTLLCCYFMMTSALASKSTLGKIEKAIDSQNHTYVLKMINGNPDKYLNAILPNGQTPLYMAIWNMDATLALALIQLEADVNIPNKNNMYPIHAAARKKLVSLIAPLVLAGAHINELNSHHSTPLHLATLNRDWKMVSELMLHGANEHLENKTGSTPVDLLLYASEIPLYKSAVQKGKQAELTQMKKEMDNQLSTSTDSHSDC